MAARTYGAFAIGYNCERGYAAFPFQGGLRRRVIMVFFLPSGIIWQI